MSTKFPINEFLNGGTTSDCYNHVGNTARYLMSKTKLNFPLTGDAVDTTRAQFILSLMR